MMAVFALSSCSEDDNTVDEYANWQERNEQAFADKVSAKLAGKFAQNAPAEVVAAEREKLENTKRRIEKLTSYIESL